MVNHESPMLIDAKLVESETGLEMFTETDTAGWPAS